MAEHAIVFIGFMGAGKTTAARAAADALGRDAIDVDEELERRLGAAIPEVFERHGEAAFREHEERLTLELLTAAAAGGRGAPGVLSLGGGAVQSERVRGALRRHRVALLDVDVDTAWRRAAGGERPLARDRDRFAALHAEREPIYSELADAILPASRAAAVAALPALGALDSAPAGTRLLWARSADGEGPVFVARGLLSSGFRPPVAGRRYCVTDSSVARAWGAAIAEPEALIEIEPGEPGKTLAAAERVWRELARAGMTRDDHVVALGGGVVGDLAGFCAATYQRGVPVVQLPTTLVAQVDSAYGGKTGVDLPEGKNYVGAYHPPAAVLTDPETLATLPEAELAAGYAEVVKTALIAGGDLWERVRGGAAADDERTILACARTKLAVVAADAHDDGRRQVLNLGHTVGHAIETATGYRRYRHGEAVALGLLAALRLSGDGAGALRAEVAELLRARGLPARLDGVDPGDVAAATSRDKKRRGAAPVPFVLVRAPGDVRHGQAVAPGDLRAAIEELAR